MIDWSRPYTARWRVLRVDRSTWADSGQVDGVDSARVSRDRSGSAPELESGELSLSGGGGFEPGYCRIAMTAVQGGQAERVDVATLLCELEEGERGAVDAKSVTGRSVLHPAAATEVEPGEHAPAGSDGAQEAARLLRSCVAAPVSVEGGFELAEAYDFAFGTSCLEAAWQLLGVGGYRIRVDGAGRVTVGPMPAEPALELDRANARLLMPGVSYELDWSAVPNRFTAMDGQEVARAVNLDGGQAGYAARGYWVDASDDAPKRVGGETLQAFAERRLAELSVVEDVRGYSREWWPNVYPFDVVRGSMADARLDGDMRVVSQDIECAGGLTVKERAAREVRAWPTE